MSNIWTDHAYLTRTQYGTGQHLEARRSIYDFQRPFVDLPSEVLRLAALGGSETILDAGCGTGQYLKILRGRGHEGRLIGVDLSTGILQSSRDELGDVSLASADVQSLPLLDGVADASLAAHMMYHVEDPAVGVRELRRVTRRGGPVILVLNGADHLRELREVARLALESAEGRAVGTAERLRLDDAVPLLAGVCGSMQRFDFESELVLQDADPVASYLASTGPLLRSPNAARILSVARSLVHREIEATGSFRIRTHAGVLISR